MQISITDIIAGICILELLIFFSAIIIFSKKRPYQLLLSIFLLSDAFYLIGFLLFSFFNDIQPDGVHLFFIGTSFGFILGPALYLYTKSIVKDHFHIKLKDYLHLLPFVLYNLIYALYFYFESTETKIQLLNSSNVLPFSLGFKINFLMNIQILVYTGLSIFLLNNYNKRIRELYSTIHHLSMDWLKLTLYLFLILWLIDFTHFLLRNTSGTDSDLSGILTLITLTLNLIFINMIIYKGFKRPLYFIKTIKELPKSKIELLSSEEMNNKIEKLKNYMATEKPYITADLTLVELAQRLDINPLLLLKLIKQEKHQTFFDFINKYRIEDAKMILADPSKRKMTMIEIIYGVGFDSKSVFKDIFKNFTGVYPGEYRKRYLPYRSHHNTELKLPD